MKYKCIVVDLDNTLWNGVIGEVGRSGIEPNVQFQRKLLELKERGVILAISSKNDLDTGLAGFAHPDMVLQKRDFTMMQINWENKDLNVGRLALGLNIDPDAVVFIDDSPYERNAVRHALPTVTVLEDIEELSILFPDGPVTDEDRKRTEFYQANQKRKGLAPEELTMVLTWEPFNKKGLPRIHQLVNKTNQFNLTTRRYTEEELAQARGYQFWLSDVFGDQGMIGVIIVDGATFGWLVEIDAWLMSCRVIGRGVEKLMFDVLVEDARACGFSHIRGTYRPTSRNGIVRGHYKNLGFKALGGNVYEYDLRPSGRYRPQGSGQARLDLDPWE